jgi:hypothetical protein
MRQSRLTFAMIKPEKSIPKPPMNKGFPKGRVRKAGPTSGIRKMLQGGANPSAVAPWYQSIDSVPS